MVCSPAAGCSVFTTTTLMRKVFVALREEVSTFFDAFEPVLEKTLESPLDCKEIQPVHSKDQS